MWTFSTSAPGGLQERPAFLLPPILVLSRKRVVLFLGSWRHRRGCAGCPVSSFFIPQFPLTERIHQQLVSRKTRLGTSRWPGRIVYSRDPRLALPSASLPLEVGTAAVTFLLPPPPPLFAPAGWVRREQQPEQRAGLLPAQMCSAPPPDPPCPSRG